MRGSIRKNALFLPGKRVTLPPLPPLRTAREIFTSCRSSFDKPFLGAGISTVSWIMDLSMAG
jgi:hypothetical protein